MRSQQLICGDILDLIMAKPIKTYKKNNVRCGRALDCDRGAVHRIEFYVLRVARSFGRSSARPTDPVSPLSML